MVESRRHQPRKDDLHQRAPVLKNVTTYALAGVVAALYAGCYVAIKAGQAFAPPLRFAGMRAFFAGLALMTVLLLHPALHAWPGYARWRVVVVLALLDGIGFSGMFLSPEYTSVTLSSVLGNTGPLLMLVLGAIFLKERITLGKTAALLLGIVGISFITHASASRQTFAVVIGAALPLLAAFGSVGASIVVKRASLGDSIFAVTAWQYVIGGGILLGVSAFYERSRSIDWNLAFVGVLAFLAVAGTAVANSLWYRLVQISEVSRLSLILFLVPVFGVALGVTLFDEAIETSDLTGIAFILLGIAVAMFENVRRPVRTGHLQD